MLGLQLHTGWITILSQSFLVFLLWLAIRHLFHLIAPAVNRRFRLKALDTNRHFPSRLARWMKWIILPHRNEVAAHYQELLAAAGSGLNLVMYALLKRCTAIVTVALFIWFWFGEVSSMLKVWGSVFCMTILVAILCDRYLLEQMGRRRRTLITAEIYSLCHQLSYYAGSDMNLHAKLSRCTSFTSKIQQEWLLLLQEWYEDSEEALYRFRQRIGTEEAYSFAETLSAMRRGESDAFYALLRQRIADYKESLDLAQEGKKETYSYLLFVMAGIPILNTFRIFIYPWVEESQKLFQTIQ